MKLNDLYVVHVYYVFWKNEQLSYFVADTTHNLHVLLWPSIFHAKH